MIAAKANGRAMFPSARCGSPFAEACLVSELIRLNERQSWFVRRHLGAGR
jgi:hypothetical protein